MHHIEKSLQPIHFYDLSSLGLLKVTGKDAQTLLQGQLTCHLERIPHRSSMGAHCNREGRVLSFFHLFLFNDAYYLLMMNQMVALTLNALKKYAIFYQVELTDASHEFDKIGYQHKNPPLTHDSLITLSHDETRYILLGDTFELKKFCENSKLTDINTYSAWHQLNIKQMIPSIYPETSGKFLAHDIHLHYLNAIDFDKGCYTGQEIIARMHYKGKLKKHLYRAYIECPNPPIPGTMLHTQKVSSSPQNAIIVDICCLKTHQETNFLYEILIVTDEITFKNTTLFLAQENDFYPIMMESL